jgi:xanthine/uracil permease
MQSHTLGRYTEHYPRFDPFVKRILAFEATRAGRRSESRFHLSEPETPLEPAPSEGRRRVMQDLVAAGLWALAVVPAAIGFWLVAGSLAGVTPGDTDLLIVGSLLGLSIATLLQVLFGFRLAMYEGPSSAYLAAITVVCANHNHGLNAVSGGLLGAGVFVCLLAVLRVDRLMIRMFTPLVANVFVLVVSLAVVRATFERMVGVTHGLPGNGDAWLSSAVVVVTILSVRRIPRFSPYSLLAGLLAGTGAHFALAGVPHTDLSGGLAAPAILPWGSPDIGVSVLIPFALGGALAAFNTIASGMVAAREHGHPERAESSGRAFVAHGVAQAGGALVGNVLGNVSRLDSVGITRLLGNSRRAPLIMAAVLVGAFAFVRPVVAIAGAVPLNVSAALLAVVLSIVVIQAARNLGRESRRVVLLVVVPSLIPSVIWIVIGTSLSPTVQLIANPMLWGVTLGVLLERAVAAEPAPGDHVVEAA